MNQILVAPQFGGDQASASDERLAVRRVAKDPLDSASSGRDPTIIVKRRWLLEAPVVEAQRPQPPLPKAPKVFVLAAPATLTHSEGGEVVKPYQQSEPSTKIRRRRDPARKPTLVQHIVFARQAAAPYVAEPADHAVNIANAGVLSQALARLDEELRRCVRCHEAATALDAHFKRLGF